MQKSIRTIGMIGLAMMLISNILLAQNPIPNPGFESWSGGEPDGWTTTNSSPFNAITQSSTAHSGSSAMRGEVLSVGGFPFPPGALSGNSENPGFPVSQRYTRLSGYYQFAPAGANDNLLISVGMMKNGSTIGAATFLNPAPASSYTQLTADIFYGVPDVPDSAVIAIQISNTIGGLPTIGSSFLLDDLVFESGTAIGDIVNLLPEKFVLEQNFPNPFNPSTTIHYYMPTAQNVDLAIYNVTGQRIKTLVNEKQSAGNHQVQWNGRNDNGELAASGVYIYRLQAGSEVLTRKMALLR